MPAGQGICGCCGGGVNPLLKQLRCTIDDIGYRPFNAMIILGLDGNQVPGTGNGSLRRWAVKSVHATSQQTGSNSPTIIPSYSYSWDSTIRIDPANQSYDFSESGDTHALAIGPNSVGFNLDSFDADGNPYSYRTTVTETTFDETFEYHSLPANQFFSRRDTLHAELSNEITDRESTFQALLNCLGNGLEQIPSGGSKVAHYNTSSITFGDYSTVLPSGLASPSFTPYSQFPGATANNGVKTFDPKFIITPGLNDGTLNQIGQIVLAQFVHGLSWAMDRGSWSYSGANSFYESSKVVPVSDGNDTGFFQPCTQLPGGSGLVSPPTPLLQLSGADLDQFLASLKILFAGVQCP